jgi:hypothetical protein
MAAEIYKEIARLKWPGYQVSGDGKIAVVLVCQCRVVLCEIPLAAEPIRAAECAACRNVFGDKQIHHRVVVLTEPTKFYKGPRIVPSNRIWERDRNEEASACS